MSPSVRPSPYDLLGDPFDLASELKHEAPPYLPRAPPTYKLKPHRSHGHQLRAVNGELSPSAGPEDPRLSGFDLAESIWSQDSDLTLEDLPLDSDSISSPSHSSTSSHWSGAPLTPSTSRHHLELELQPPQPERALPQPPGPTPLSAQIPTQQVAPDPDEPAPAYSRDPTEFDPALLASLDTQLRLNPFEAFEDMCWASFSDSAPAEAAPPLPPRSASASRYHASTSRTNLTVHSTFSESSMATMRGPPPPVPPISPTQPPPAYPYSKPLPNVPPPSPIRPPAPHTQPSFTQMRNPPGATDLRPSRRVVPEEEQYFSAAASGESVQFFPVRPARQRSKSVGGTKTVMRLQTAIARLRGRE